MPAFAILIMLGRLYFPVLILILSLIVVPICGAECNASHMTFVSQYTLGKQDEFNRSFALIQTKLPTIEQVTYTAPDNSRYSISDIKAEFYYRDSKQKVTARGEDVLIIEGGRAQVDISFKWQREGISGSGTASGLSDDLTLAKQLIVDNNRYSYVFLDAFPFEMPDQNAFKITRLDPPSTTDAQRQIILTMLNSMKEHKDVKGNLELAISKVYNNCINDSLHDEHFPLNLTFQYKWVPKTHRPNVTVPFVRRPTSVDVQKIGLISTFDIQTVNSTSWTCGTRKVLEMPLDPNIYGGIQQFISFDFYENVLSDALHRGILNSDLDQYTWGHRMFQFYAGDLYEVLSNISEKYYASQKVKGECVGNPSGLTVFKNDQSTFNVTLKYGCGLELRNEKVVSFSVNLELTVKGKPRRAHLDFEVVSHAQTVFFNPIGGYQIINKQLAELMVADSLNRLYQGDLFGCGWPQSPPRDYPHFRVQSNYTAVIDSAINYPSPQ